MSSVMQLRILARSADENADAIRSLLEAEVAAGWMKTWDGSLESLKARGPAASSLASWFSVFAFV